jgi:hypothetical protein
VPTLIRPARLEDAPAMARGFYETIERSLR